MNGWLKPSIGLLFGIIVGIYIQHRWPVGRWRASLERPTISAPVTVEQIARMPDHRRLVLLCIGQSNAANYGSSRRAAGANVYAFANGRLYAAIDPLPGADGDGGSIWSRLGARLIATGRLNAVVFAIAARGSTYARDWANGGNCHSQLLQALQALREADLPVDAVLWQQGEEDARMPTMSGSDYATAVQTVAEVCRRYFPHAPFFIAQATFGGVTNEQIRQAQALLANQPGMAVGPDIDQLGASFRRDGIHLNDAGLDAAAAAWLDRLKVILPSPGAP